MKYVDQRNGVFRVRISIPVAARHAFPDLPKSGDYAVSLGTRIEVEAFAKAPPIITTILRRRDEALKPIPQTDPRPIKQVPTGHRPAEVEAAIERWRVAAIGVAEGEHFNGVAPPIEPFGDEAVTLSELRYKLTDAAHWRDIPEFEDRMRAALASQGLDVPKGHPLLEQRAARAWFGKAWANLEYHTDQFRHGVFDGWPEEPAQEARQDPVAVRTAPPASLTLKSLLERFLEAKEPKSEEDIRYHWKRLVEFLGDVPVGEVEPRHLEDYLIQLRRFPFTRKPAIANLPFREIIEKHPKAGPPLAEVTVWKSFVSFAQVFGCKRPVSTAGATRALSAPRSGCLAGLGGR
jgi:hypothetical protein